MSSTDCQILCWRPGNTHAKHFAVRTKNYRSNNLLTNVAMNQLISEADQLVCLYPWLRVCRFNKHGAPDLRNQEFQLNFK